MLQRSSSINALLLLLACAIVLPFAGLGAINLHWKFAEDEERAQRAVDVAARDGAVQLAQVFEDGRSTLNAIASRPGLTNSSTPPCDPFFEAFGATLPEGSNFFFVDASGTMGCSSRPPPPDASRDVRMSEWYQALIVRRAWVVSVVAVAPVSGRRSIMQATPVFGEDGRFLGSLQLPVDTRELPFLKVDRGPGSPQMTVVAPDGVVVASSVSQDVRIGQRWPSGEMAAMRAGQGQEAPAAGLLGGGVFVGHAYDPIAGWRVVAHLDRNTALAGAREALRRNLLSGLALVLGVAWLAALVGRRVSAPIVELARSASQVADGVLNTRAQVGGPRELATVARQFNAALDAIEASRCELVQSEHRLRMAMDVAKAIIWECDLRSRSMRLVRWHDGRDAHKSPVVGLPESGELTTLFDDEGRSQFHRQVDVCLAGRSDIIELEHRLLLPGDHATWVYSRGQVVERNASGIAMRVLGISHDISARKSQEAEIHRLSHFDRLTGLPNRRAIGVELGKTFARMKRANVGGAILYIDLDQFKTVNDAIGHDAGDQVLQIAADRLRAHLREGDTLAHMGGDEFVILLTGLAPDVQVCAREARLASEKFRSLFAEPMDISGRPFATTVSIGVTLVSSANASADDALRQADTALYRAKGQGRNQIAFFEPDMQSGVEQRLALEQDLALAIDRGQLQVYLQSQVDKQGQVVGAEALLRWAHPKYGMVPPPQFIQIAEETGQIRRMGAWVIRQVCDMLRAPKLAQSRLRISVNVSPRQFHEDDFVEAVQTILTETGVGGERLVFEVTEGLLLSNVETVIGRMHRLAELGIRFSIDDFGTGYSSLAYLKRLPLWEIKIDKSFVRDVPGDADDVQIIKLVLSLAEQMGFHVVAEGVEHQQQADFLFGQGCRTMQGYLFGRPQAFESWMAAFD